MSEPRDPMRIEEWTPATSQPGEILTPMGQVDQVGHFARSLRHRDPRNARYRRQMWRTGMMMVGLGLAIMVAIAVVSALLSRLG